MSLSKHPLVGLLLLIGGMALVAGGSWFAVDNFRFVRAAESTVGSVVALHRRRGARGSTRVHPIFEYRDPVSGRVVRSESKFGVWPSPFDVGDDVMVAISNQPPRVEIDSFWTLWFLPLLLAVFGIACLLAGRSILRACRPR